MRLACSRSIQRYRRRPHSPGSRSNDTSLPPPDPSRSCLHPPVLENPRPSISRASPSERARSARRAVLLEPPNPAFPAGASRRRSTGGLREQTASISIAHPSRHIHGVRVQHSPHPHRVTNETSRTIVRCATSQGARSRCAASGRAFGGGRREWGRSVHCANAGPMGAIRHRGGRGDEPTTGLGADCSTAR